MSCHDVTQKMKVRMKVRRKIGERLEASEIKLGNKFLILVSIFVVALLISTSMVTAIGTSSLAKETEVQVEKTGDSQPSEKPAEEQKQVVEDTSNELVSDESAETEQKVADTSITQELSSQAEGLQEQDSQPQAAQQQASQQQSSQQEPAGQSWSRGLIIYSNMRERDGNASINYIKVIGWRANLELYLNEGPSMTFIGFGGGIADPGDTVFIEGFRGIYGYYSPAGHDHPQVGDFITFIFGCGQWYVE